MLTTMNICRLLLCADFLMYTLITNSAVSGGVASILQIRAVRHGLLIRRLQGSHTVFFPPSSPNWERQNE